MEIVMADYDSFYRLLIRSMTTGYPFLCNWQAIPIYRYLSGLICPEKSTSSMTFVKISTRNGFVKYEAKQSLASLKCTRWWVRTQKMIFETYNWCVEEPECICLLFDCCGYGDHYTRAVFIPKEYQDQFCKGWLFCFFFGFWVWLAGCLVLF